MVKTKASKPKAAKPAKEKPAPKPKMTATKKDALIKEKLGELQKARRAFSDSVMDWDQAHAVAAEKKKTMEKNQSTLNGVAKDLCDIQSGNYTPSLFDGKAAKGGKGKKGEPTTHAVDPALDMPIGVLTGFGVTQTKCDALASASGGDKIGLLEKMMRDDRDWHTKVDGMGQAYLDKFMDGYTEFRKAHPFAETLPVPEAGEKGTVLDEKIDKAASASKAEAAK